MSAAVMYIHMYSTVQESAHSSGPLLAGYKEEQTDRRVLARFALLNTSQPANPPPPSLLPWTNTKLAIALPATVP